MASAVGISCRIPSVAIWISRSIFSKAYSAAHSRLSTSRPVAIPGPSRRKWESSFQTLRTIVRGVDPALLMTNFRTLEEQIDRSLNTEHMLATLSGGFGVLALLLSLVGLYGVMSFVVTQRTREVGVRLALGARRWSAIWLVLRDALAMVLCGMDIGLPVV